MKAIRGVRYEASQDLASLDPAELVRRALRSVRRNLPILAACVLGFMLLGGLYSLLQTPFYSARASIIIDPRVGEDIVDAPQASTVLLADALVVDSEVEVLSSRDLLGTVATRLDLLTPMRQEMAADAEAGEPAPSDAAVLQATIDDLADNITISREGTTYVLRIDAKADTPEMAAAIANTIADVYFETRADVVLGRLKTSRDYIETRLGELSNQVMAAEKKVEDYKYQNDIQDDSENRQGPMYQELADNETAIIAARSDISTARTEIATIERALSLIAETPEGRQGGVLAAQSQLITALGGEGKIKSRIVDELNRLRDVREANIAIGEGKLAALAQANRDLKDSIAKIMSSQVELRELSRSANAVKAQYEALLANYEEAQTEAGFHRSNARIIERATAPTDPSNPSAKLVLAATMLGGLLVGLGLVFLREQVNDTVRSSDDVSSRLGSLYLGAFPRLSRREVLAVAPGESHGDRRARYQLGLLTFASASPFSLAGETLRRTIIEMRMQTPPGDRPLRMAAISAFPGEGKTTFAANLAFFLAAQGNRVALIDGDLRNQSATVQLARVGEGAPAVPLNASGSLALRQLTATLHLVSLADPTGFEAAEQDLVAADALLLEAGLALDTIIVDTPPLAFIPDSLSLSPHLDAAVLVVRWGRTAVADLKRVLPRSGALADKIIGVCLTQMTPRQLRRYESVSMEGYYGRYDRPAARKG